ncbi:BnaC04g33110D [Brassica napus]|uniref:BnaC04g33110D protein n=2 Tax=Brassica napus TaxID=3708 RepID=A0A078I8I0_BRANA|nr:BnaC04g33110D [Brassica napus]
MKLGFDAKSNINRVLESWRSSDDPSSGEITYGVERHELVQSVIRKKGMPTFRRLKMRVEISPT